MTKRPYTWTGNDMQPGVQTEEGRWHTLPHPNLEVQVMREGYENKPGADRYWHPDYVIFKQRDGWYVSQRTSKSYTGPYKTRPAAKADVE